MKNGASMLIVEDDPALMRGLSDAFGAEGFDLRVACDGDSAVKMAIDQPPDIVLLDLMLPGFNGFEVCEILREAHPELPILIVSARGGEADIVRGLELGADDYITKPFSIAELRARVGVALRRTTAGRKTAERFGGYTIDFEARSLRSEDDAEVPLTEQEFAVLAHFVTHAGRAITRDMLLRGAWKRPPVGRTRTVDRCVAKLRAKIEANPAVPQFLHTVRGVGYRFQL